MRFPSGRNLVVLARRLILPLPVLSGLLLALSFPDPAIFPLAWVALVPYLVFLLRRPDRWTLILGHLLFSLVYLGGVLYWIGDVLLGYAGFGAFSMVLALLALFLLLSLFLVPFSLGIWLLAARSEAAALVAAPALWVVGELLRNSFPAGGFPWGAVGYSQFPAKWLIQIADLGGVNLLSFLVLTGNCALLSLIRGRHTRWVGGVGFVILVANFYGWWRLGSDFEDDIELRVALVQPVIELSRDRDYYSRIYFRKVADAYRRSASQKVDWVVLPEAPNPFRYGPDFYFTTFWNKLTSDFQVPVLLNSTTYEDEGRRRYNSVYLVDAEGKSSYRYDKTHLVPFGEYLPWGGILGFARPLVGQIGGFTAGDGSSTLGTIQGQAFGTLICYESIFPNLSRELVAKGAKLLVNITNDHWFGESSAPRQHMEMAAFRAIENRRPILRAANSGFSALIDATGRVRSQTALNREAIIPVVVRPGTVATLFSLWGQGLNVSLIMVSVGLAWALCRQRAEKGI